MAEVAKRCQKCGNELSMNALECEQCGHVQQPSAALRYSIMSILGLAAVGVVAVAIFAAA